VSDEKPKPAIGGGKDSGGVDATGGLPPGVAGPELARAVLDAAKARRDSAPRPPRPVAGTAGRSRRARGYSGAGPDPRDPQLFGSVLAKLVKNRGWEKPAAEATVFGAWERVVGADVAAHSHPIKLTDGELTIEAESTAWAMQLRSLAAKLIRQIASEIGPNVVTKLHIHGPAAPNWTKGPRRVAGRGPRDTYG
jgi:predicted nucleic acid-binding Zn ribbon protein